MAVKRTTIELDEELATQALQSTGATLRATVEEGLRLLIARSRVHEERRQTLFEAHLRSASNAIDLEVLESGEAWR